MIRSMFIKLNFSLIILYIPLFSLQAQIEINPENKTSIPESEAHIKSDNIPFWLGAGIPQFHFDTSSNAKVGLGAWHKKNSTLLSPTEYFEHAKLHIRHEGGPGSNFQNQKGPHLLLDESTSDNPAVLRFRQSTITTDSSPTGEKSVTPGARSWDLRGFANGASLGGDEFRLTNSGAAQDLVHISGNGDFTLSGDGNTRLEIKGPSDNQPTKLELGAVGESSNGGRLWYNSSTGEMQVFADGAVALTLDAGNVGIGSVNPGSSKLYVDGYSTLGDHANTPKIKTWYDTANLPSDYNSVTNHNILPVRAARILSISILVTNDDGQVVPPNFFEESFDSYYYYTLDGTIISFYTDDSFDVSSQKVLGKTARIFVTYTD